MARTLLILIGVVLVLSAGVLVTMLVKGGDDGSSSSESPIEVRVRELATEAVEEKVDTVSCTKDTKHPKQYQCQVRLESGACQDWSISDGAATFYDFEGKGCQTPTIRLYRDRPVTGR